CVSAAFATVAILALALTGYLAAGLWGFVIVGVITSLCPYLIAHSRFMKEDPALILGLALVVLASRIYFDAGRVLTKAIAAAALGAACAVAISGKYYGIVSLALAVPILLAAAPNRGWSIITHRLLYVFTFIIVGILTLLAINHRILGHYDEFRRTLDA